MPLSIAKQYLHQSALQIDSITAPIVQKINISVPKIETHGYIILSGESIANEFRDNWCDWWSQKLDWVSCSTLFRLNLGKYDEFVKILKEQNWRPSNFLQKRDWVFVLRKSQVSPEKVSFGSSLKTNSENPLVKYNFIIG